MGMWGETGISMNIKAYIQNLVKNDPVLSEKNKF